MAFRTWGKPLLTALGVSMLAGAGQLGIAYGFGIVRIAGDFTDAAVNRWPAQLVWVGWCAALAAVVGAVVTERLTSADPVTGSTTGQLALAGAAALGATVVAPLCMQPARATQLNSVDPVWAVGICATLGAVVGAGAALAVLLRPPLGWNVAAVAGTVWFVALVSALPSLVGTGPLPTVRLGVFEPAWLATDAAQRLATIVLPLSALLAGAASGALARRRGHPPLIAGATGAAGPVLVAFAYLTAGPGDPADRYQLAPYYGALLAVATGLLGATAAALARWPLFAGWPLFARSADADPPADGPAGVVVPAGGPADLAGSRGAALPGALGARPPGTLRAALSGMRAAGLARGRGVGLPGTARAAGHRAAIEPTDILRPLPTGPTPPAADGPADPAAQPGPTTARRVPATIGDPLPDDRTGDTPARSAGPHSRGDDARDPAGADGPAGAPPAHWEWPMAAGTPAARPTAPAATAETTGTGETTGPVPLGEATDPIPTGQATDPTPTGQATEPAPTEPAPTGRAAGPTPTDPTDPATEPAPTDPATTGRRATDPVPTGEAADRSPSGQAAEAAARPRPRLPLPDLDKAASWDAFGNAARRFATPTPERHPVGDTPPPRDEPGGPGELWQSAARATGAPPSPGTGLSPVGGAGPAPAGGAAAAPVAGEPEGPAEAGPSPEDTAAGRSRLLRPLFRRGRTRAADDPGAAAERDDRRDPEPLPAQDEEYVDWVTGLARPVSGETGGSEDTTRRSLRASGRHHRD
ncbi:hypothetical protein [Micromonospora sp. WMMD712]|uniref:hypothetical protein n=1 Tax=Micromonospora sp. WMMD712 TaxID=3016096 RepID=UPI00249A5842|nr:hypothetical protein [Micromonospora sp. WMMD712]WFE58025.1 hypothetical protein O7633_14705 [Micromonospora sp. WMMD712]